MTAREHITLSAQPGPRIEVGHAICADGSGYEPGASAAAEALASLRWHLPSAVLVFGSPRHDLGEVLRGVRSVTGETPLVGASTAGEIRDGLHEGSVVVALLASPFLSVRIGVGERVSAGWRAALTAALAAPPLGPYFDGDPEPWAKLTREGKSAFAMMFSPGATGHAVSRSYEILEGLKRRSLGRLPIFGASAAGAGHMGLTCVFADAVAALVLGRELSQPALVARENEALRHKNEALHQQVQGKLERLVSERTAQLSATNASLEAEIAERRRAEAADRRHSRALHALSACNEALVRAVDEQGLLDAVCRTVVEVGGYRMSWVGLAERDARKTIRPAAYAGHEADYLREIDAVWSDSERGRGPAGTAIASRHPVVVRNIQDDPFMALWHAEAAKRGYASVAALPLIAEGAALGALAMYSGEVNGFEDDEMKLLAKLADDLAFGVAALRGRAEIARLTAQLLHADRLATMGTLAAGVAHEINNPLAYVLSGVEFASDELKSLAAEVKSERALELLTVLREVHEGCVRIRQAVRDLKTFSRRDEQSYAM